MIKAVSANIREVSIKGDTFEAFRDDFDEILTKTLDNMRQQDLSEAEITVKMKVKTIQKEVEAPISTDYSNKRTAVVPTFSHTISTAYKVETKVDGQLAANQELIYDEEAGQYILVDIQTGQQSFRDYNQGDPQDYSRGEVQDVPAIEAAPLGLMEPQEDQEGEPNE